MISSDKKRLNRPCDQKIFYNPDSLTNDLFKAIFVLQKRVMIKMHFIKLLSNKNNESLKHLAANSFRG
jgi:hypothetical protein